MGVGIDDLVHTITIALVATTAIGEDQAAASGRWENAWMSASSMESGGIFE
jgi:biotin-(acetyl-CoA carboxylase) ligase